MDTLWRNSKYVGIDVGSTTVKAVVTDSGGEILWKDYKRHGARQSEHVRDLLVQIHDTFPRKGLKHFVTGSGGRALAPHLGAEYIQEVNAVTLAVEKLHADTGSVIELGGQDAKVIIFKEDSAGQKSTLLSMNDKCAGGTGATIDKIFKKIGISMEDAANVTSEDKTIHPIAAKCGVFAETDVVGLTKSGVDPEEIVVSLCTAIVNQNLEVLVRGNVLPDKVLLLGGPNTFLKVLGEIWRREIPKLWKLHAWKPTEVPLEELIHVPDNSLYFAAIGATLFADQATSGQKQNTEIDGLGRLDDFISNRRSRQLSANGAVRDGLIRSGRELEEFTAEYSVPKFVPPSFAAGQKISGWIGVDGGSTSSKLAVIDDKGELIYRDYMLSIGNPISDIRELFAKLKNWAREQGIELHVNGTGVTGYASSILDKAFSFDAQVVETVAHMKSAVFHYGEVDIICDIGGQDIKILFMKHGRVIDFRLNTQCSAGNGYFLQGMAEQFDIPIDQYAERAFTAKKAPSFNYGCAVFMEQDKVNFQQLGWSTEEIMPGLALVLPLNIWNYVVQESNIAKYGSRIVLQGGTQKNLAAVKAQVDFIKRKIPHATVHVHKYTDICGAFGAAIEARDSMGERASRFIGLEHASRVAFETRNDSSTRCEFCNNKCPRTFVDIDVVSREPVHFISGNACDKGASTDFAEMKAEERRTEDLFSRYPNLAHQTNLSAFADYDFEPAPAGVGPADPTVRERRKKAVVGIPKLLNLFFFAPFFNAYLRSLGIERVVYSSYTTHKLWEKGNKWGSIDPCFPAKVAPAHVYELLGQDEITHICMPIVTHLPTHLENVVGNNACVIQMGTPEVVQAAFARGRDVFAERGVEYWKPFIKLDRPREAEDQLFTYFQDRLGLTREENKWAVSQAYAAQKTHLERTRNQGRQVINWLVENDKIGIVVLGHPYHHDPGLNHGLLEEFQKRGYPILSIESLPVEDDFLEPLFGKEHRLAAPRELDDVWLKSFNRNTNHKIWAAKVVSRHPNLAAIDLSSFKCGHDAPTYSYIDNIMDISGTPHFLFHDIDQNKPHASMKIRLQTFEYFLKIEEKKLKVMVRERAC
ncbi:MAG: CoA activase [Deltaproteobacteria bacterium]|nr:CoA activase [Deltaproteobacteria bacterium]